METALRRLQHEAFVERWDEEALAVYPGYRTEVVERPRLPRDGEEWLRQGLARREHAAAFQEIGDTLSEEYSPAFEVDPQAMLQRGIAAYEGALKYWTPDVAPRYHEMARRNLARALERARELGLEIRLEGSLEAPPAS